MTQSNLEKVIHALICLEVPKSPSLTSNYCPSAAARLPQTSPPCWPQRFRIDFKNLLLTTEACMGLVPAGRSGTVTPAVLDPFG